MKSLTKFLIPLLLPLSAFAGGSGGGGGPRPGMEMFSMNGVDGIRSTLNSQPIDFVRAVSVGDQNVVFQYKAFDKDSIEIHTLNPIEMNPQYVEALQKSLNDKSWVPVSVELQ